jgi:hypothetical protein
VFTLHVTAIHALILHTYQVTAYAALKEPDADKAANLWKQFLEICDLAIRGLKVAKEKFPHCGTPDLYDLALDYRCAAAERYRQNSQDAECAQKVLPKGLFPSKS